MTNDYDKEIENLEKQLNQLFRGDRYDEAMNVALRLYELLYKFKGSDHERVVMSLCNVARILNKQGVFDEAEGLFSQALEFSRRSLGQNHRITATIMNDLASARLSLGKLDDAESLFLQALQIRRTEPGYYQRRDYAQNLNNLAFLYKLKGDFKNAEKLYNDVLDIRGKTLGNNHPDYAITLEDLGDVNLKSGDSKKAIKFYQNSLTIKRHIDRDSDYLKTLLKIAEIHKTRGEGDTAIKEYEEALDLDKTINGEETLEHADITDRLGFLYRQKGGLEVAERLYKNALTIRQKVVGKAHPSCAGTLSNLGGLYSEKGLLLEAESYYKEAESILLKAYGKDNSSFAMSCKNLADLYVDKAQYNKAKVYFEEALSLKAKLSGKDSIDYGSCLQGLGYMYREMGRLDKAIKYFKEVEVIYRNQLGTNHPIYAGILGDLGAIYFEMYDLKNAELLTLQALKINVDVKGEENIDVVNNLTNLADIYRLDGHYFNSIVHNRRAADILYNLSNGTHHRLATILNNLASTYGQIGALRDAENVFLEALQFLSRIFGEDSVFYAKTLNNLADIYTKAGDYDDAEKILLASLKIMEKAVGKKHPNVGAILDNLAPLYAYTSRYSDALKVAEQSIALTDRSIDQIFSFSNERQRMTVLEIVYLQLDFFISIAAGHYSSDDSIVKKTFNMVLKRKSIATEALSVQRDSILKRKYPKLTSMLDELQLVASQIGKMMLNPMKNGEQGPQYQNQLNELINSREKLESELAISIPELKLMRRLRENNAEAIANTLPEQSALIEYVQFHVFDYADRDKIWSSSHYAAFVLNEGQENVKMIDLGDTDIIDKLISEFKNCLFSSHNLAYLNENNLSVTSARDYDLVGSELRKAIFDPVRTFVGDGIHLFIAPDGNLSIFPMEILPADSGKRLLDHYSITYLTTGRDLLRFNSSAKKDYPSSSEVIANPDFDLINLEKIHKDNDVSLASRQSRDLKRSLHFQRLAATKIEGEFVAKILNTNPLMGSEVLESTIKKLKSPCVLHFATHGFFLPNQQIKIGSTAEKPRAGMITLSSWSMLENPLLRSGLALAGANTWLRGESLPEKAEDGILNAEDVLGMDLSDTALVVLSACETGLGDVLRGEGVYGLRRSFVLAGAKTLVMSLWKVSDRHTQELMRIFYEHLREGYKVSVALKKAQLIMKEKYPNPYYWGAFICQGDPNIVIPSR